MILMRPIFALLDVLQEESSPLRIAWGFVLGMALGLMPAGTLQWGMLLAAVICIRVNFIAVIVSTVIFYTFALIAEPVFNSLGMWLLTGLPFLHRLWAWMFHAPFLPYTQFNNTIVLGSFVVTLILAAPLFLLTRRLLAKHGPVLSEKLRETYVWRSWATSRGPQHQPPTLGSK